MSGSRVGVTEVTIGDGGSGAAGERAAKLMVNKRERERIPNDEPHWSKVEREREEQVRRGDKNTKGRKEGETRRKKGGRLEERKRSSSALPSVSSSIISQIIITTQTYVFLYKMIQEKIVHTAGLLL